MDRWRDRLAVASRFSVATTPLAALTGAGMWLPGDGVFDGGVVDTLAWAALAPVGLGLAWAARRVARRVLTKHGRLDTGRRRSAVVATNATGILGAVTAGVGALTIDDASHVFAVGVLWGALPAIAFAVLDGGTPARFGWRLLVGLLALGPGFAAGFGVALGAYSAGVFTVGFPLALVAAHLVITTAACTAGRAGRPARAVTTAA